MVSIINAALCLTGIGVCVCRLGTKMSSHTTKTVIRVQYVMWLGVDLYFLMTFPKEVESIVAPAAILAYLLMTFPAWRYGQPLHAIKTTLRDKIYDGHWHKGH